jgi:hypothetical protein
MSGTYYYDSFLDDKYSEIVSIENNTIIRSSTTEFGETYQRNHKILRDFSLNDDFHFLLTEESEIYQDKTGLERIDNVIDTALLVLSYKSGILTLSKTLTWPSSVLEYEEIVAHLEKQSKTNRFEKLVQMKWVSFNEYYPKHRYDELRTLPTITENEIEELRNLLLERSFDDIDTYYSFLKTLGEQPHKVNAELSTLLNLMNEQGLQPFTSTRKYLEQERSNQNYIDYYVDAEVGWMKTLAKVPMVFFGLASIWIALIVWSKLNSKKILPRPVLRILSILGVISLIYSGCHLGTLAGWQVGQINGFTGGNSIVSAMLAVAGLIIGGAIAIIGSIILIRISKKSSN